MGQELASFMLGLPTSGQFDVASFRSNQAGYIALFLQDDWKVRPNLTLNLGLRWEKEISTTERYDRQLVGFDGVSANSVTAKAKLAYAANPQPELPVAQFNPAGGVILASPSQRATSSPSAKLFSPRFGFAWTPAALSAKTTVRGGFGIFYFTEGLDASVQPGAPSHQLEGQPGVMRLQQAVDPDAGHDLTQHDAPRGLVNIWRPRRR